MTREQVIDKVWDIMVELHEHYDFDKKMQAFRLVSDYNSDHEDEIFMTEINKEDGYEHDGLMLEYDIILYSEDI